MRGSGKKQWLWFCWQKSRPVQVGNFRVEPPGLFRGRGEHPRMGMLKKRIYPKDITINIGKGEPIPEHPYPGQQWKEIRHDNTVTWLAFWKDTISEKVGPGSCLPVWLYLSRPQLS